MDLAVFTRTYAPQQRPDPTEVASRKQTPEYQDMCKRLDRQQTLEAIAVFGIIGVVLFLFCWGFYSAVVFAV